jgi:Abortive infection C-terminus
LTVKFIRSLCTARGITVTRDKPLHSLFGEYVKHLRTEGRIESEMTERILKSSISVLEAFYDVRNNRSFAHDNPVLNYDESLLIFNNVTSTIGFLRALEERMKDSAASQAEPLQGEDEVPF